MSRRSLEQIHLKRGRTMNKNAKKVGSAVLATWIGVGMWSAWHNANHIEKSVEVATAMAPATPQKEIINAPIVTQIPTQVPVKDNVALSNRGDGYRVDRKAEILNTRLQGKLKGKGELFVSLGKEYNVNSLLVASICIHETGNGTSKVCVENNNPGGLMQDGKYFWKFRSIEAGILKTFETIRLEYIDKGLTDIDGIGRKYAPVGVRNDPQNLNACWINNVTKIYTDLEETCK